MWLYCFVIQEYFIKFKCVIKLGYNKVYKLS